MKMSGDYERQQQHLQQLWDELMSDEEEGAEDLFGHVYSSDGYKTTSSDESSDEEYEKHARKRRKQTCEKKPTAGR